MLQTLPRKDGQFFLANFSRYSNLKETMFGKPTYIIEDMIKYFRESLGIADQVSGGMTGGHSKHYRTATS